MTVEIDPILASVIQRRLKSITEEMGLTLLRTTRSPILNEARDFVTGLYDADGQMLEQTEYIPVLAFALQPVCKTIIDYFVVHELCHFHCRDHTEAFWNEIDKVMPEYRERKEWLRKNGAGLDI